MYRVAISLANIASDAENLMSDSAMLVISIRQTYLLVPVDTLIVGSAKYTSKPRINGSVPWTVWGPPNTRDILLPNTFWGFGSTIIARDRIFSFNAYDAARDIYTSGTSVVSRSTFHTERTSVPVLKGAETPMFTRLPYRETMIDLSTGDDLYSLCRSAYDLLYCIEDHGPKVRHAAREDRIYR